MFDFTLQRLELLYRSILDGGYHMITYAEYATGKFDNKKYVILRHDVDARPQRALSIAELEHKYGIRGSYYIRNRPAVYRKPIIQRIAALGHEIGYHYEDLSVNKGNYSAAYCSFKIFLNELRTIYPVTTICMHGSPLSRYDNRALWNIFDYRKLGIQAELYRDTNFGRHWYLTDTGRGWNSRFSVRDKVNTPYDIHVEDTMDLIRLFKEQNLPPKIMMNIHPQRWADDAKGWLREMITQKIKNPVKLLFIYLLQKE